MSEYEEVLEDLQAAGAARREAVTENVRKINEGIDSILVMVLDKLIGKYATIEDVLKLKRFHFQRDPLIYLAYDGLKIGKIEVNYKENCIRFIPCDNDRLRELRLDEAMIRKYLEWELNDLLSLRRMHRRIGDNPNHPEKEEFTRYAQEADICVHYIERCIEDLDKNKHPDGFPQYLALRD